VSVGGEGAVVGSLAVEDEVGDGLQVGVLVDEEEVWGGDAESQIDRKYWWMVRASMTVQASWQMSPPL
jgi:hypothetical protein